MYFFKEYNPRFQIVAGWQIAVLFEEFSLRSRQRLTAKSKGIIGYGFGQ